MIIDLIHIYAFGMLVGLLFFIVAYYGPFGVAFQEWIAGQVRQLEEKDVRITQKQFTRTIAIAYVIGWPFAVYFFALAFINYLRR